MQGLLFFEGEWSDFGRVFVLGDILFPSGNAARGDGYERGFYTSSFVLCFELHPRGFWGQVGEIQSQSDVKQRKTPS